MEIRLTTPSTLDKYPAKQHARRVASALAHGDSTDLASHHGLIYLAGTPTRLFEDSDQSEVFRQRRYFYYLTGVNESDCHLTYEICTDRLTLWLPPISVRQAVWVGRGSTTKEALRKYDVDRAYYSDRLAEYLTKARQGATLFILHSAQVPPGDISKFKVDAESLVGAIAACRVIKDDHEVGLLRRANEISARAHTAVLRKIRNLTNEAQVEALFTDVSIAAGALQGYDIIAGSGGNGAILHYTSNRERFGKRQTMVLDAGAEWQNYSSDVTRTFPLNGTFSREAQDIYDLVQKMQNVALEVVKPGSKLVVAHLLCHRLVARGLLQLGILRGATEDELLASLVTAVFYPHGLGHHLGLEVHDVTPPDSGIAVNAAQSIAELESEVGPLSCAWKEHLLEDTMLRAPCTLASQGLRPGMVITVEPGIYFNKYALEKFALPKYGKYINVEVLEKYLPVGGVRIEDNFLITQTGWEVISSAPKGEAALKIIRGEA